MINNRLAKLSAKADRLLDSRQKARFKDLSAIEKVLVARLIQDLNQQLEEKDKRISSKKGFVSLAKAIDAIFDEVEKRHLRPMSSNVVKDLRDVVDFGAQFYEAQNVKGGKFAAIQTEVDKELRRRMGITDKGTIQQAGYLDELFRTDPARDEVKKMVAKSVSAGIPMKALEKKLRVMVTGTDQAAGVLERRIGGFVLDAYQAADAITNNSFGKRLGMKSFVYSGGLIETSREFCRKRNNKTFTTEDAKEWEKDPTLPRTKAEKDSGVITDYDPLVDRGRWNCRHRILYISDTLAQVDKEFQEEREAAKKLPKPKSDYESKRTPDPDRKWDLQKVIDLSSQAAPALDRLGKDIATKYYAQVTPINLKSAKSIARKANDEEKGNFNEIKDGVRSTIVADLDKHKAILGDLANTSVFWRNKAQLAETDALGYSGNIVNVVMDNGAIGEVQVNTAKMIYAKEKEDDARRVLGNEVYDAIAKSTGLPGGLGHAIYEEYRLLSALDRPTAQQILRMKELRKTSREYYSNFR